MKKIHYLALCCIFAVGTGCVSAPRQGQLSSYTISGVSYVPLISLCDLKQIHWDYDILTRGFELNRQAHRITVQIGEKTIFVDGSPRSIASPIQTYRGMVVVPDQFRKQIIDALFPDYLPQAGAISLYRIKKVIIDAGHGGKDPGAISKGMGLREKNVTLDIAKRLSGLLRTHGVDVIMTRSTDRFIPLESRAAMTENSGADLFISIHANANPSRSLSGFEVYYITPRLSDSERAVTSARTRSLSLDRNSFSGSDPTLKEILWDMIYTYNRAEAVQLSQNICGAISRNVDTRVIGVKSANFCVLRGSCIPAILIEVGFLSNSREEQRLNDGSYRQKIAEGIIAGMQDYAKGLASHATAADCQLSFAQSNEDTR